MKAIKVNVQYVVEDHLELLLPDGYSYDDVDSVSVKWDDVDVIMNDGTVLTAGSVLEGIESIHDFKRPNTINFEGAEVEDRGDDDDWYFPLMEK